MPDKPAKKRRKTPRSTAAEMERRVLYTVELLARGLRKGDIKRALREKFGAHLHAKTCERYISRAFEQLRAGAADDQVDDLRAQALAFYQSVIADPLAKDADRIKAQVALCKLMGLDRPAPQEHTHDHQHSGVVEVGLREKLQNRIAELTELQRKAHGLN